MREGRASLKQAPDRGNTRETAAPGVKPPAPREEPFRGILPFHKVFEKLFSSPQRQTIMVVCLEDAYTNQGETLYFLRDESALRRRKKASKAQQISTPLGIEFQINF